MTSTPNNKHQKILESLNLNRKVSEKNVKKFIKEDNICNEIKGLIYSTINISREQINTQNDVIFELREELSSIQGENQTLRRQIERSKNTSSEKEASQNEIIAHLQRENRQLKKQLSCDQNRGDFKGTGSPLTNKTNYQARTAATKIGNYTQTSTSQEKRQIIELQDQINILNNKIVQMKIEFQDERSLSMSNRFTVKQDVNSLVNKTNESIPFIESTERYYTTSRASHCQSQDELSNSKCQSIKQLSEEIKISYASNSTGIDQEVLQNIQNMQYQTIEKLKISLRKSEERANRYEEKFCKIKDKIYSRCKRLNDEIVNVKAGFQAKMSDFFNMYIKMLKEIIFANNKVIFHISRFKFICHGVNLYFRTITSC